MRQEYYAAKNKDIKTRLTSSSGGIFIPLAEEIISLNGIVYGAAYNEENKVVHKKVANKEDLKIFKTSKYVQSEIGNVYSEVKQDLSDGKMVLFSGTPCQINALNLVLKNINTDNLITIDIICHGTPQIKFFEEYKKLLEHKYKSKITKINFRYKDKKNNVEKYKIKVDFLNNKSYISTSEFDPYYQMYELMVKEACFKCPFANTNRVSDITLGDFHEFSSKLNDFNDNKGVSLVIVNSKKGKELLTKVINNLELMPKTKAECIQPHLEYPPKKPINYDKLQEDYRQHGFKYIVKKYKKHNLKHKIKFILYKTNLLPIIKKLKNK